MVPWLISDTAAELVLSISPQPLRSVRAGPRVRVLPPVIRRKASLVEPFPAKTISPLPSMVCVEVANRVVRGPIVTVAVSRDDLLTALAGNTDLVRGLLQTIVESLSASRMPTVLTGTARDDLTGIDADHLTPVQTLLALRQVPLFATLSSDELGQLTAVARAVPTKTGDVLADETDPPCLWVVLSGALAATVATTLARSRTSNPVVKRPCRNGPTASVVIPWIHRARR